MMSYFIIGFVFGVIVVCLMIIKREHQKASDERNRKFLELNPNYGDGSDN